MQIDRGHYRTTVHPTPFHSRTAPLNVVNEWSRWKDYTTSAVYYDEVEEYFLARNSCGVYDLMPMSKHRIGGTDAQRFLDRLLTRDVKKITQGKVGYCVWCDDDGQVIDDGTLFHLGENDYRLCAQEKHLDWLLISAAGFDVEIEDETHDVAALALQGPTSCSVLRRMGLAGVELLKPFEIGHFDFSGAELIVSRTGFTGDLGYELWFRPDVALTLWDSLFEAGRDLGIGPMGSNALEMTRIEAGFIQVGDDFVPALEAVEPGRTRSPFELGLGWLVDLDKANFTGRRALLAEKQNGSRYNFVRLDIDGNKPASESFIYNRRGKVVGTVTSAMWSPSAKANIALASLEVPWGRADDDLQAEIYYHRELKWSRVMARCRVVEGPFFDPPRRRAVPAPAF